LPSNIPQGQSAPATLGIEIAPLPQLEELHARISGGGAAAANGDSTGKEVVQKVEVGKVAEKVVKNVSCAFRVERGEIWVRRGKGAMLTRGIQVNPPLGGWVVLQIHCGRI